MATKEFTETDVLSLLDFSKNIEQSTKPSDKILKNWRTNKDNTILKEDEHGLSVVGIYEQPIILKGKEVGKIIIFNYTGVGGGWHNDIFKMVEIKYFGNIVTEKSVLQRKVIFDKFPIKAERLAFMFSGPFGHPEVLYACGNCNHQFEEFSYPSFCFSCGCKFK